MGCTKISTAGCKHCYAEVMATPITCYGIDKYKDGFKLRYLKDKDALNTPRWEKSMVFGDSMTITRFTKMFHWILLREFLER